MTYEGKVGKELGYCPGQLLAGPWFEYEDSRGRTRICQPDFIYDAGEVLWVVEVKLSWVPEAAKKLKGLYGPIVEIMTGRKPQLLVIVKNLRKNCPRPHRLSTALTMTRPLVLAQWTPE